MGWTPEHHFWSFVQSASSQAQLTATLAGISITAMVLVMSPLFLGAGASRLGADRQSEIRDLFKFLLIAFTCLVTASMLWGQLNGFSLIEASAWADCQPGQCLNAVVAPVHILFLSCASLMTLGVVALVVALLELVLLSSSQPAQLSRLVLATYAVTVSFASLQVMFGVSLVAADVAGSAISDKVATERAMFVVPVIVVLGIAPAIRSWLRSQRGSRIDQPSVRPGQRSSSQVAETCALWAAGASSAIAVQVAPELAAGPDDYGAFAQGGVLAIIGGIVTLGYACLIWWSLWAVIDRLSIPGHVAAADDSSSLASMSLRPLEHATASLGRVLDAVQASRAVGETEEAIRRPMAKPTTPIAGRLVLRNRRKPYRSAHRRHSGARYGTPRRGGAGEAALTLPGLRPD